MTIIPGLTSTMPERIPQFVDDLRASDVRTIAIFPTVLTKRERTELYRELETIDGLQVPHVHVRTDFTQDEMQYLSDRFGTELFNIHPRANKHAFGPVPDVFAARFYVENVEEAPDDEELTEVGGICPDFSHLENARLQGRDAYVATVSRQMREFIVGCCHVSAIRVGDPNKWNGGWDHHNYLTLSDFDYLSEYAKHLPRQWLSLELENSLPEQLAAIPHLERVLGLIPDDAAIRH